MRYRRKRKMRKKKKRKRKKKEEIYKECKRWSRRAKEEGQR